MSLCHSLSTNATLHSGRKNDASKVSTQKSHGLKLTDCDGDASGKRRRKRPRRWSDRPPSPPRDAAREEVIPQPKPVERLLSDAPVVGNIYCGKVSSVMQFGCFVQLEGLR